MKNIFNTIIHAVSTFFKVHTAIAITVTSVVVVSAIAIPVGIHIANNDSAVQSAPEQITENDKEAVASEDVSLEENVPSEESNEAPVVSAPEESPSQQPSEDTASTSSGNNNITIGAPTTSSAPVHPTSGLPYKQRADLDSGISWDGQSPIIYTYSDGTTGTEKKLGATYEYVPGMTGKINEFDMPGWEPEEFDPHCKHCGKLMGDGTNNTCVRWMMGDVECPQCGTKVLVHTCHTCKE